VAAAVKTRAPKLAVTGAQVHPPAKTGAKPRATRPRTAASKPAPQRADFKGKGTPPPVPPAGAGQPGQVAAAPKTWGERISGLLSDPKVWWGLGVAGGGYVAWKLYQSVSGASQAGGTAATGSGSGSGSSSGSGSGATTGAIGHLPGIRVGGGGTTTTPPGTSPTLTTGGGGGGGALGSPGPVGSGWGGGVSPGLTTVQGGAGPVNVNSNGGGAAKPVLAGPAVRTVAKPAPAAAPWRGAFTPARTPSAQQAAKTEAVVRRVAPAFYHPTRTKKQQAKTEAKVKQIAPGFYMAPPRKAAVKKPPARKAAVKRPVSKARIRR